MNEKKFVNTTINQLDQTLFDEIKGLLVGEYVSFAVIKEEDITRDILSEKVCGYFEKLELKTGKSFDKQLESYLSDLDSIVGRKIAKEPQQKKKDATVPPTPRARKYYERACSIKSSRQLTMKHLLDYSRIMMCLYAAIINNRYNEIDNFDFSTRSLKQDKIIGAMKTERAHGALNLGKKLRFDTKELYCSDTCTFILTIIMLYYIKSKEVIGEY